MNPSITIAVALHKGGVGKTVTALALSAGLARAGKRTLLVDLDPQGHSTIGNDIDLGPEDLTLRDHLTEPGKPLRDIVRPSPLHPKLWVLPASLRLAPAAQTLYTRIRREELLKRGLEPLQGDFEYIVIDCPPSLGPLVELGVAAADFIVLPSLMEARAAEALQDLLELVRLIKGPDFSAWRILRTRVDRRKTTTNMAVMSALEPWVGQMFETEIPQSEPLNQAQMARKDIYAFDPRSPGAIAYEAFVKEVMAIHTKV